LQKGEHKKAVEIAKNMLKLRANIKFIVQATGLPEDEIKKLMK